MSAVFMISIAWTVAAIAFSILWLVQKRTGDAGIVDVAWSMGVGLTSVFFCIFCTNGDVTRRWVIGILAMLWAIRLSSYVLVRVLQMPEDGRYQELKSKWGDATDWRMYRFYQFQAAASVLFAIPMLIAALNESPMGWIDYFGIGIWIVAIGGETIADSQLHRFRQQADNRGKVCQNGLWRYSRHPNYFFEWMHWWTYVCLAITGTLGWLTIIAPLTMLFFILKVTGIPPTEAQAIKSTGQAYRRYQQTTSAFFPWFPRQLNNEI